jgi:adenylate kinase family enzyme
MQRVAILGAGGAGKTVLARRLGAVLDLPVIHLDQLRYDSGWNVIAEEEFVTAQRTVVDGNRWVIDGNSLASLRIRAAAADTVIVLDPHPLVCLAGITMRRLRYGGGQHADGVYVRITLQFLRYVFSYRRKMLPRVFGVLDEHAGHAKVLHLTSRRAADRLISELGADAGQRGHP